MFFAITFMFTAKISVNAKMGVSDVTGRYYFKTVENNVDLYNHEFIDVPILYDKQDSDREIITDECEWISSNTDIAVIRNYGLNNQCKEIVFKKKGSVTLTCIYAGERINIKYNIRKNEKKPYLRFSKMILTVDDWDEDFIQLNGSFYLHNKKAVWKSSNKKVLKLVKKHHGGTALGQYAKQIATKKPGKATITCKVGKKKFKCKVTVIPG